MKLSSGGAITMKKLDALIRPRKRKLKVSPSWPMPPKEFASRQGYNRTGWNLGLIIALAFTMGAWAIFGILLKGWLQ